MTPLSVDGNLKVVENSELFTRRNLIALVLLAVLLLIIPFGVNLVREQQILRSRASVDGIVEFKNGNGSAITETENSLPLVHERGIQVVLQDPRGPAPSASPSFTPSGFGLQQTMVAADGKSVVTRTCNVNNPSGNRGVDFDHCTNWQTAYNVASDASLPQNFRDSGITSWHEYPWQDASGAKAMQQILVAADGKSVVARTCGWPGDNRGVDFSKCGGWSTAYNIANDTSLPQTFRDNGITSWHEYFWGSGNDRGIQQIMVHKDGKQTATRTCEAPGPNRGADFNQCTGWQTVYNIANDTTLPQTFRDQGVTSWHEYYWGSPPDHYGLQQVMVAADGKQTATRTCHAPGPNRGVDFNQCTGWSTAYVVNNDSSLPESFRNQGITTWFEYVWGTGGNIYDSSLYAPGYNGTTSSLFNQIMTVAKGLFIKPAEAASACPAPGQVFSCSDIKCADEQPAPGSGCYPDKYASDCQANCVAAGRNSAPATAAPAGGATTDEHGCNTTTQTWSYCDYSCPGTTLKVTGGFCYGKGVNPDGACVATGNCAAAAAEVKEVCRSELYTCTTADGQPGKNTCTVCKMPGTPPPGITYGDTIRGCGTCVLATTAGNPPGPGQSASPTTTSSPATSASPSTGGTATLQFVILADSDNAADLNDNSKKIAWTGGTGRMTQAYTLSGTQAGQKKVFAKFIYSDGSETQSNKDLVYRPVVGDPTLSGITCAIDPSNSAATKVTMTGTNLVLSSQDTVAVTLDDQTVSAGGPALTPTQVVFTIPQALTGTHTIKITRGDSKSISGVCTIGQSQLQITAQLSCKTVTQPASTATVELLDASNGTSLYKNDRVSFSPDGVAQNILPSTQLNAGAKYVLTVKSPFTLTRAIEFTASSQSTTVLPENVIKLPLGDVAPDGTPDGVINNIDQSYVRAKWSPTSDVTTSADTNIDRRVNSNDWACVRSNFGKTNDQVVR